MTIHGTEEYLLFAEDVSLIATRLQRTEFERVVNVSSIFGSRLNERLVGNITSTALAFCF